eukprot:g10020.t1
MTGKTEILFDASVPGCKSAYRRFLISASKGLDQGWSKQWINPYALYSPAGVTQQDSAMGSYLNRPDVRRALHVEDAPVTSWPQPDGGFEYTQEYSACSWGQFPDDDPPDSMIAFYRYVVPRLQTVVVYNGDADPCVSYEGTRTAIERVGFPQLAGGAYRPWFYRKEPVPASLLVEKAALYGPYLLAQETPPQLGGEVVDYEHNFAFATFHGSGHMVPQFRPEASLHFLRKLVSFERLSPLLPSNDTLETMSDNEFSAFLDQWTDKAKAVVGRSRAVPLAYAGRLSGVMSAGGASSASSSSQEVEVFN